MRTGEGGVLTGLIDEGRPRTVVVLRGRTPRSCESLQSGAGGGHRDRQRDEGDRTQSCTRPPAHVIEVGHGPRLAKLC